MRDRGSASIELVMFAPVIAIFIVILTQFSSAFHQALRNLAEADAISSELIREYERDNRSAGFSRPCLEDITPNAITVEGDPAPIGVGIYKNDYNLTQEVKIAVEDICDS